MINQYDFKIKYYTVFSLERQIDIINHFHGKLFAIYYNRRKIKMYDFCIFKLQE